MSNANLTVYYYSGGSEIDPAEGWYYNDNGEKKSLNDNQKTNKAYVASESGDYNSQFNEGNGLRDYNGNSLNITRYGYYVPFGEEWMVFDTEGANNNICGQTTPILTNDIATNLGLSWWVENNTKCYVSLKPNWEPCKLKIIFNQNNATLCTNNGVVQDKSYTRSQTFYYDATKSDGLLNINNKNSLYMERTGYHYKPAAQWNTKADGSGISLNQATSYSGKTLAAKLTVNLANSTEKTVNLYANWEPNSYTITFDGNGGTLPAGLTTLTPSYETTNYYSWGQLAQTSRTGYTLKGYYDATSGGNQIYEIKNSAGVAISGAYWNSNNKWIYLGDVTAYAQWIPNTYTVTYDANGGTGSMSSSTVTYDTNFMTRQNTFTREGYRFKGWNEKADGTGTAWNIGSSSTGTYESGNYWKWSGVNYAKNITLYAQWEYYGVVTIYDGSNWRKAVPYIYDGSAWKKTMPYIYNGSTWDTCN